MGKVLKENHVEIYKVRAQSSQFRYTYVMMNMNLLAVVTPTSIYFGCSNHKTFWEEKFTIGELSAVNMKNCGCRNVRKHREIKGSDKYVTLEISLKFDNLEKIKITFSESKGNWKYQERG